MDLTIHDAVRDREIPLRVYLPEGFGAHPVILFSHGMGGSRAGSSFLGKHWAASGYIAVFLQHAGSDEVLWRNTERAHRLAVMEKAANYENFLLRIKDVSVTLGQLERWNSDSSSQLHERLDLEKTGLAGHSFGATTTQALAGETLPLTGTSLTDPRIRAALAMSPAVPPNTNAQDVFSSVKIPWMLMTGTHDIAPIGNTTMESRLAVYPALRGTPKFELVLNRAEHSVFIELPLPGDRQPRDPNHHQAIKTFSTAFWDAYLKGDAKAVDWLTSAEARNALQPDDHWQFFK